ncbi:MAG: hypothetical protein NC213_07760 [Acetobacter sp.]|nr:hypothetical protein [Bacteroides sp.]MCM1341625.1 hypothetical protein [Acetobacter sp.]MCM1434054.1 hypothetical protein [Clostridiales bacterium]
MLKCFLQNKDISQIDTVCNHLNKTKHKLLENNWNNPTEDFELCANLFSEIKEIAIQRNDEQLANSQFIFKDYFKLFCNLLRYFEMLENGQYKESWNKLQDCLDAIKYIGRFTEIDNRLELNDSMISWFNMKNCTHTLFLLAANMLFQNLISVYAANLCKV